MKKKRILAGVLAVLCVAGVTAGGVSPEIAIKGVAPLSMSYVGMTVNAEETDYAYRDTTMYTHSISLLSIKETVDKVTTDYSTWTDDAGFKYQIAEVKVTHEEVSGANKKTVIDFDKYYPAVVGYSGSSLDIAVANEVEVPAKVKSYLEEGGYELVSADKAVVVASSAFAGTKLKSIDLSGIEFIGDKAFADCPYITVETIPATVKYMGKSIFSGSGLKTIEFLNKLEDIPASICADTKVSKVTFAYPELVKTIGNSAFKNAVLTSYILEESNQPVIIDGYAFAGCSQIANLTLPNNVLRVNESAFEGCTAMKSLILGDKTLVIDKSAFSGCTGLTSVQFNDVLQSIGGGAFRNCTSLATISDLPNSLCDWVEVTSTTGYGFGNAVFSGCTSLKNISLPSSLTKVPEELCLGCTSLATVSFGDSITSVSSSAFKNCLNLQEVSLSSKVSVIGDEAFSGCSKLKSTIADECESVGNNAYANCTALTSVTLSAEKLGTGVFSGCTKLTSADIDLTGVSAFPDKFFSGCESLSDVSKTDFSDVQIIGVSAFSGCTALKKIDIPNAIIIEDNAFNGCTSLQQIKDGEITVQDYGASCFKGCASLVQSINSKASTVGASAFEGSGISSLHIEGTVGNTVVFGNKAFANCDNLTSAEVVIPEGIEYSVGSSLFEGCNSLKTCTYTGSEIPVSMFKNCDALTEVNLPKATDVLSSAFSDCIALKKINGVTAFNSVNDSAFSNCFKLESAYCDENTTFDGTAQYSGCSSIKSATVSNLTIKMFANCTSLSDVTLSSNITVIPSQAFLNCSALTAPNFKNIKEFGASSCQGSGIKQLKLTEVNTIGKSAFAGCNNLYGVDVEVETISQNAFKNCVALSKAVIVANTIENSAFSGCVSLVDLSFPTLSGYSLTTVQGSAFLSSNLMREVVIPESVTSIGSKAFGYSGGSTIDGFLIVGTPGSAAEEYASDNGLEFQDVATYDAEARILARKKLGDVDLNGLVTVSDAVKMQKWLTKGIISGVYYDNMDMNGDGTCNCFDLILLKRMLLDGDK